MFLTGSVSGASVPGLGLLVLRFSVGLRAATAVSWVGRFLVRVRYCRARGGFAYAFSGQGSASCQIQRLRLYINYDMTSGGEVAASAELAPP